jgi:predicted nucleic acid-binding protein
MSPDGPKTKLSRLLDLVEKGEDVIVTRSGRPVARFEPAPGSSRTFLDTNILLYGDDLAHAAKQQRALELILEHKARHTGVVSLQVLQEYFVNATRKLGLDPGLVRQKVETYCRFDVVEPVAADILAAIDFHRLHRISYWDALVLHCARKAGCRVVLSEDMQHGQEFDGVRIINPFL